MRDGDGLKSVSCFPLWMISRSMLTITPHAKIWSRLACASQLTSRIEKNHPPCWCVSLTFASVSSLSCCSCRNLFRIARAKCSKKLFCFLMSVSLVHFRWKSVFRSRVFRAPNVGCLRCSLCFTVVLILCGCSSLKMFSQFSFTR